MTLVPIGEGLAATVIAAFIFAAWMAIGSLFVSRLDASDEVTAPGAILIGSGITSFLLAIGAAAGFVRSGVLLVATLSAAVLVIRWRAVIRLTSVILEPYIGLAKHAAVLVSSLALGAILWAAAISPPRSADAMRYHLALATYLDSLALPEATRPEYRTAAWFDATERYARQLHEVGRDDYLAMKRRELSIAAP